jgi:hypothetical protein
MTKLYEIMEAWSFVMEPGNTPPVDIYPFLKLVPEQLLGMWRSRARAVGDKMNALYSDLMNAVLKRREEIGPRDCFLERVLDQQEKLGFDNHAAYFMW